MTQWNGANEPEPRHLAVRSPCPGTLRPRAMDQPTSNTPRALRDEAKPVGPEKHRSSFHSVRRPKRGPVGNERLHTPSPAGCVTRVRRFRRRPTPHGDARLAFRRARQALRRAAVSTLPSSSVCGGGGRERRRGGDYGHRLCESAPPPPLRRALDASVDAAAKLAPIGVAQVEIARLPARIAPPRRSRLPADLRRARTTRRSRRPRAVQAPRERPRCQWAALSCAPPASRFVSQCARIENQGSVTKPRARSPSRSARWRLAARAPRSRQRQVGE